MSARHTTSVAALVSRTLGGATAQASVASWLDAALVSPLDGFMRLPGKRFRAHLVEVAWEIAAAASPSPSARELPPALPEALELVHAGSLIVDDIQDGATSRRGAPALHCDLGVPLALNAGNALYFLPLAQLSSLELPPAVELAVHRELVSTMSRCHAGQALDLYATLDRVPLADVPALAASIAALKTGSLTAAAAKLGALAAEAPLRVVEALGRFGHELGVALQQLDDLGNLSGRRDPGKRLEDLRTRRLSYPWAWLVEHGQRTLAERLRLLVLSGEAAALEQAGRDMLATVGEHAAALARERLRSALRTLEAEVGVLEKLRAEVRRLEVSYG